MSAAGNNNNKNSNAPPLPIGELNVLSTSTPKGYQTALNRYDEFVKKQNELFAENGVNTVYPKFNDLTEVYVCGEVLANGSMLSSTPPIAPVLSQFSQYLFEEKKSDGDPLAPLVQVQYLSGVKSVLFKKFKPLAYTGDSPQWYEELYRGLNLRATALAIKRGAKVTKKHVGLVRKTLLAMLLYLVKHSDNGYEERAVIAMLYHAVGRGSEVAATTWESAEWDDDKQFLLFDWGEIKTGQQYIMTLHPNADSEDGWLLCSIHSIACNLICGSTVYKASASAEEAGMNFMFNNYFGMADGGAASKVSRIIQKCRDGGVEDLPEDFTGHGLRVAAADEMMFNVHLPFFAAIARGGWDCKADTLLFYYLTQKLHVAAAGKALAGWANPNVKVHAPTLEAIYNDKNRGAIDAFCHELFQHSSISQLLDTTLKGFRSRMVASLLMYYANVKKELGRDSAIIRSMYAACVESDLEIRDLDFYGKQIKKRFQVDNALNLAASSSDNIETIMEKAFHEVQKIGLDTLDEVKVMHGKVSHIKEEVDDMKGLLEDIHARLPPRSPSSSPERKRAKVASAPPPNPQAVARKPDSIQPAGWGGFLARSQKQQTKADAIDWKDLGNWDTKTLLIRCLKNNENFESEHFLRGKLEVGSSGTTRRGRARNVLRHVKLAAEAMDASNMIYFYPRFVPKKDDEEERKAYFTAIEVNAARWAIAVKDQYFNRLKVHDNIPDDGPDFLKHKKSQSNQKMSITALGAKLEKKMD